MSVNSMSVNRSPSPHGSATWTEDDGGPRNSDYSRSYHADSRSQSHDMVSPFSSQSATWAADGRGLPADGRGLPADGRGLPADGRGLPADGRGLQNPDVSQSYNTASPYASVSEMQTTRSEALAPHGAHAAGRDPSLRVGQHDAPIPLDECSCRSWVSWNAYMASSRLRAAALEEGPASPDLQSRNLTAREENQAVPVTQSGNGTTLEEGPRSSRHCDSSQSYCTASSFASAAELQSRNPETIAIQTIDGDSNNAVWLDSSHMSGQCDVPVDQDSWRSWDVHRQTCCGKESTTRDALGSCD